MYRRLSINQEIYWWGLKPYLLSDSSFVLVKYMSNWIFIIISKPFEITDKRDIGEYCFLNIGINFATLSLSGNCPVFST